MPAKHPPAPMNPKQPSLGPRGLDGQEPNVPWYNPFFFFFFFFSFSFPTFRMIVERSDRQENMAVRSAIGRWVWADERRPFP